MAELINHGRVRDKGFATWIYWIVTVALIIISEVLAIRVVIASRALRSWTVPSAFFLPVLVLLPATISFRLYRLTTPQVDACNPIGNRRHRLTHAFLQVVTLEYVVVVWALSILASVLTRGGMST